MTVLTTRSIYPSNLPVHSMSVVESVREALRSAIAERDAAKLREFHAKQAEQRGQAELFERKQALASFDDIDLAIAQFRAEQFKAIISGAQVSDLGLLDDFAARRVMRDEARNQFKATKAEQDCLVADLDQAESTVREAKERAAATAIDVLVDEGVGQAQALIAAWNAVLQHYDRLCALADCRFHDQIGSHPIKLPPNIEKMLRIVEALDDRQFPNGRNDAAARAGELWCCWFKALLTDPTAEAPFDQSLKFNAAIASEQLPMDHVPSIADGSTTQIEYNCD